MTGNGNLIPPIKMVMTGGLIIYDHLFIPPIYGDYLYHLSIVWLVVWNIWIIFPFSWECHHPNWRTHIFQRGRYTTKQSCVYGVVLSTWNSDVPPRWAPRWHCGRGNNFGTEPFRSKAEMACQEQLDDIGLYWNEKICIYENIWKHMRIYLRTMMIYLVVGILWFRVVGTAVFVRSAMKNVVLLTLAVLASAECEEVGSSCRAPVLNR